MTIDFEALVRPAGPVVLGNATCFPRRNRYSILSKIDVLDLKKEMNSMGGDCVLICN
jgi:hypothetical protein